jgi:hypothetical protein
MSLGFNDDLEIPGAVVTLACFVSLEQVSGCFVGHCPALNVFSQGETETEALRALQSAVKMHVAAMNCFHAINRGTRQ